MVFSFLREARRDQQLILPPPPRHCPHGTSTERPPSAGLGLVVYTRIVREPGVRCDKKRPGWMCAGLLYVEGPTSSMRMRRSGSAAARRAAMTQPVVPPTRSPLGQKRVKLQRDRGRPTSCDNDIVFFVDFGQGGSRHSSPAFLLT